MRPHPVKTAKPDKTIIWLGLGAFASAMLFVWQGLDFTDLGWWLTAYQQFYTHPDGMGSMGVLAACWLTCFIGHWVGVALGGGVMAYKLGWVATITASAMIAYRLLAFQFGPSRLLAAMVLLTLFFTRQTAGNWIDYNQLTALFYLAGAALLFYGLVRRRKLLMGLAGMVLGANLFVRFPNLLGITLVSAIWLNAWSNRWTRRECLLWSAWFLGAFALGILFILFLIVLNGDWNVYFQNIRSLIGNVGDAKSVHPARLMLNNFFHDHVRAFDLALPLAVFGGWLAGWTARQKPFLVSAIVSAGTMYLLFVMYHRDDWRWIIPGLCYVVLLITVFREWRKDPSRALSAFLAGLVLLLAPLGSVNGIINSVYGLWLALPLTLMLLWRGSDLTLGQFSMKAPGFRVFAWTIVLALLLQSLATAWRHTYRDSNNRLVMTHSINHPLLRGTFTTAARAKVVAELLEAMPRFTKPDDAVLAYNGIPLLFFLSGTHPWLGDPWPDFAGPNKMAVVIRRKEQAGAALPCIVRATGSTEADSWPTPRQPPSTWLHQDETRRVFEDFEQRHGYVVAWTNDFFEILTPPH
jgi:hypothetical protein